MGAHSAENAEVRVRVRDERLDELARLAENATPGPWVVGFWPLPQPTHYVGATDRDNPLSSRMAATVTGAIREADAEFIAAAGTDLAALVADLRYARADIERLRDALRELVQHPHEPRHTLNIASAALAEEPRA